MDVSVFNQLTNKSNIQPPPLPKRSKYKTFHVIDITFVQPSFSFCVLLQSLNNVTRSIL